MDSQEFEKNKLDLIYQKNLQKLNAVLALGSIGAITVIGAYFSNPLLLKEAVIIIGAIAVVALASYFSVSNELDKIIEKIDRLK